MMTLAALLKKKKNAIVQRWLDAALAVYPKDASAAFGRQKDPFANPVGHSLRVGTDGVFASLLDGMGDEKIRESLHEMVKIRAVQQFSASQAVGFVFGLKDAVRAELGQAVREPQISSELVGLERRIDQVALTAFDVFVACREQLCELRINEVKRSVGWVLDKMSQRDSDPELVQLEQ